MRFLVLFTINLGGSIKVRVSNLRLRPDQTLAQSSSNTFQQKVLRLVFFMKYLDHCWYIEPRNREKSLTLI